MKTGKKGQYIQQEGEKGTTFQTGTGPETILKAGNVTIIRDDDGNVRYVENREKEQGDHTK